jgi:hypothetical protein
MILTKTLLKVLRMKEMETGHLLTAALSLRRIPPPSTVLRDAAWG